MFTNGHVEHDHQLGDPDDGEDEPAAIVMGRVGSHGRLLRHIWWGSVRHPFMTKRDHGM
jgi:hypothetical protein